MSRSHSPNGAHMRYECDGCDARTSSPEGVSPQGWLVEFTRDLCPGCLDTALRALLVAVDPAGCSFECCASDDCLGDARARKERRS